MQGKTPHWAPGPQDHFDPGEEMPGAPPPDARTRDEACRNARVTIHRLVAEQARAERRARLPDLAAAPPSPGALKHGELAAGLRPAFDTAPPRPLRRWRLRPMHAVVAVLAVLMVVEPWFLPAVLLVGFWLAVVAYVAFGREIVADLLGQLQRWLQRRAPWLAGKLAAAFARVRRGVARDGLDDDPPPFDRRRAGGRRR
jgi:hypothetical protein